MGPLALADAFGVLDPRDARVGDHLNLVEERLLSLRKDVTLADDPQWFFNGKAELVKYSLVGDIHLRRDDVPCFLRHWMINYASYVSPHGGFGEWTGTEKVKAWDPAGQQPGGDLMNTAWFMENFRNLLVMEQDDVLWLARATPRAWLEQGKKIAVTNAPTYFGTVAYEIVSDVDNGKIAATTELPSRKPPKTVLLRLRHPKAVPIKGVTVNGKEWKDFNKEKETINLTGLSGTVSVTVQY
jgi:hypothetical protein